MEDKKSWKKCDAIEKFFLSNLAEEVCVDNCRPAVYFQVPNNSETSALPVLKSVIKKAMKRGRRLERARRVQDLQCSVVTQRQSEGPEFSKKWEIASPWV